MTNFSEIPECVWELLAEIMYADSQSARWAKKRGKPITCSNRGNALLFAWGCQPPLITPGSETDVTRYALAAWAWRDEQERSAKKRQGRTPKGETPAETKIIGALTLLLDRDVPPRGTQIADMARVSANTVKNFMKKHFGSQRRFENAWRRGDVRLKLAQIQGDTRRRYASLDEEHLSAGGKHRRGRTPGTNDD